MIAVSYTHLEYCYEVKFGGYVQESTDENGELHFEQKDYQSVLAVPYDCLLYTSTEIFKYPEFKDMEKARKVLETLHKQDMISYLLTEAMDSGINIKIGNENTFEELNDCSVVTATYKLNGRPIGSIGIVGPTRMDYDYCVSVIKAMTKTLDKHFSDTLGGKD